MEKRMTYRPVRSKLPAKTVQEKGVETINVVYYLVGLVVLGWFAGMVVRTFL